MNSVEQLRRRVIEDLLKIDTVDAAWPLWSEKFRAAFKNPIPDALDLRNLGNSLAEVFFSTSTGERVQSSVSKGGTAWEALVCWYLNLCMVGSRTVIVKFKREFVPEAIRSAITVSYRTVKSNTESDLLAITLPEECFHDNTPFSKSRDLKNYLDRIIREKFRETELTIVQCKTNWNDNAQIPMLWDMVYNSTGSYRGVSLGHDGFVPHALKRFSYAFVTVPTVKSKISGTSTCVSRVHNLSGGNYWGRPSQSGVASNIYEMINRNFSTSLGGYRQAWASDIQSHVRETVMNQQNYFRLP